MRFKRIIRSFAAALALFACAAAASAQVTNISGKVTLKQADGTVVPVPGAQVDIYRTDIKQEFHVKTDKKGMYQHAGIPFVGTYTMIVSAAGASPTWQEKMRFTSQQVFDFTLQPGNGMRPTLDDIKKAVAAGPATGGTTAAGAAPKESKEDKAKREELERKVKEVEEQNKKIVESNEVISRTFKAGNDALNANRVEEAITHYKEGLAVRPEEPALLANLSEALRRRGVDRYNAALKASPPDAAGMDAAKKDWTDAAASSGKALEVVKTALSSGSADAQQQQVYNSNKLVALSTRAMAMRLVATKVDTSQAQAAWDAYQEYIAAETDATKKAKAKADALQALFDSGATDLAVTQARAVLVEDPDNVDANRILGLALFASGDKAKFQEAANFLQRYVDKAPDADPLKASARESLEYLRTAENVKPDKAPSRPAGGRRRP
ncbi:MAG TPA: carboxypeptidase-like regulatory domain-containing protein [Pyrinomonadaceae bacterium]|nr:carboxypeptidase-like regulatory domain-containing protein [Pyrinomonadaceae bacterium]